MPATSITSFFKALDPNVPRPKMVVKPPKPEHSFQPTGECEYVDPSAYHNGWRPGRGTTCVRCRDAHQTCSGPPECGACDKEKITCVFPKGTPKFRAAAKSGAVAGMKRKKQELDAGPSKRVRKESDKENDWSDMEIDD